MSKSIWTVSLLLFSGLVQAERLQTNDFAFGMPLQVDGDGAIYTLAVPGEVYRHSWDASLADLRVFNSHGEEVPHLLQSSATVQQLAGQSYEPPLYPLPTQSNRPLTEEVHVAIGKNGTLIDFYGGELPLPGAGEGEYYLIDATAAGGAIESMRLHWPAGDETLMTQISLSGSDDLNHWQPIVEKYTIARLRHQGFKLEQESVPLPGRRMKYYRIHWPPGGRGVALDKVELLLQSQYELMPSEMTTLSAQGESAGPGDYRFDLGGHFPVSRLQLVMPQRNTVVQARLFSRGSDEEPWQLRHSGLFYDLDLEGGRLRSGELQLPPLRHGQWRVEVEQRGGGLGSGTPQLQLGWYPQRLLFIARGEMPFTLAFGRYGLGAEKLAIDPLLKSIERDPARRGGIKPASAGALFDLGGAGRLDMPPSPLPWQQWLLWLILLLGVALLGMMAHSLYKQMQRQS
ncbi:MAG: DUF3999 domain-containing protein [Chromatiales bacterium]|nr:DUF3999 domain-containing protein [Chromatiales bacterium]